MPPNDSEAATAAPTENQPGTIALELTSQITSEGYFRVGSTLQQVIPLDADEQDRLAASQLLSYVLGFTEVLHDPDSFPDILEELYRLGTINSGDVPQSIN